MTVSYIHHVPSADQVGSFLRLLVLWKGGVVKGIWKDFTMYFLLYTAISLSYRFLMPMDEEIKLGFEKICVYMHRFEDYIPLPFLLGFYVTQVMNRWWSQFESLPWVDGVCGCLNVYMPGKKFRSTRRKVVRYSLLSMLLVFKQISAKISKKYKTHQSLVDHGLMTETEKIKLEKLEKDTDKQYHLYWVPIRWAQNAVRQAYNDGGVETDVMLDRLHGEIGKYAGCLGNLLCYAWVNIPLVYTQIVTISVHLYFAVALLGRQHLTPTRYVGAAGNYVKVDQGTADSVNLAGYDDSILDIYVPLFTILQYIFYFGWMQVARTLINPFGGDDDEDFEMEYLIDRNFQVGNIMVKDNLDDDDDDEADDLDNAEDEFIPNKLSLNEKTLDSVECSLEKSSKDGDLKAPSINGLKMNIKEDC